MSLDDLKTLYLYFELSSWLDDAYPAYFEKRFQFQHKYLGGAKVRSERQERCSKTVMRKFAKEVDSILIKRKFPNFSKPKFKKFVEKLRETLLAFFR